MKKKTLSNFRFLCLGIVIILNLCFNETEHVVDEKGGV